MNILELVELCKPYIYGFIGGAFTMIVILYFTLMKQLVSGRSALSEAYFKELKGNIELHSKIIRIYTILRKIRREYVYLLNDFSSLKEANEVMYELGRKDVIKELGKSLIDDHEFMKIEPVGPPSSGNFEKIYKKKFLTEENILQ